MARAGATGVGVNVRRVRKKSDSSFDKPITKTADEIAKEFAGSAAKKPKRRKGRNPGKA